MAVISNAPATNTCMTNSGQYDISVDSGSQTSNNITERMEFYSTSEERRDIPIATEDLLELVLNVTAGSLIYTSTLGIYALRRTIELGTEELARIESWQTLFGDTQLPERYIGAVDDCTGLLDDIFPPGEEGDEILENILDELDSN